MVAQRATEPHVHQFFAEILLPNGSVVQDCGCGYRQRVRKSVNGDVQEVFTDGLVAGGSSLDNAVFFRDTDGLFISRWA